MKSWVTGEGLNIPALIPDRGRALLFITLFRPTLGPTQSLIPNVMRAVTSVMKGAESEPCHVRSRCVVDRAELLFHFREFPDFIPSPLAAIIDWGVSRFSSVPPGKFWDDTLNSVSVELGYGLDDRGSIPGGGWEFFFSQPLPEWLWGPPSLLSNEYYGLFLWG
jgi:hypothetical protein